jgi:hypothetical protein
MIAQRNTRTHLINRNRCVAKDRATLGAEFWRTAGRVAPQSQSAAAMLFRRALPAARQNSAHQSLFMRWVLITKVRHAIGKRVICELLW